MMRMRYQTLQRHAHLLPRAGHGSHKCVVQVLFRFADGEEEPVPGAYIEFAERRPLPQFAHLPVCSAQVKRVLPGCASLAACVLLIAHV